jgi:methylaspartate mutase epsilon subunit
VHVTDSPYHPVRADGTVARRMYVLGIPTEHTRWFMQAGASRAHRWSDFMADADAIATDILHGVYAQWDREPRPASSSCSSDTTRTRVLAG